MIQRMSISLIAFTLVIHFSLPNGALCVKGMEDEGYTPLMTYIRKGYAMNQTCMLASTVHLIHLVTY